MCRRVVLHWGRVGGTLQEKVGLTMLIITIEVDAPAGLALAVKERLAMDVEKYGDTRVIDVKVVNESVQNN